ncbi:MAG: MotA/TolQ/ExbB proton channel family protein [Tepidisphaeraceae bacterium]
MFEESLTAGAAWDGATGERVVRTDGGYAGQRWAYFQTRDGKLSITGLPLKIVEHPSGPNEYRYVAFAWRKWGGGQLALQLDLDPASAAAAASQRGAAFDFRYEGGKAEAGKAGTEQEKALRLPDSLDEGWTENRCDLWKDFGEVSITGISFVAAGGRDAGVDHLYFAKAESDLNNVMLTREQRERASRQVEADAAAPVLESPRDATTLPPAVATPVQGANAVAPSANPAPAVTPVGAPTPDASGAPSAEGEQASPLSASWGDKLKHAGAVGAIQLLLSVFGGVFAIERFFGLRQKFLNPKGLSAHARRLWSAGKFAELERLKDTHPSTLGRVISFIATNRGSSLSDVSEIAGDLVSRDIEIHYRKAYPLGIVATLAPLLGLLGMIVGMIHTFEIVSMAGSLGDPTQLAAGISEALVTTGLGLAIAIPFLSLYHYFKHRTSGLGVQLEEEVTTLLTLWLMRKAQPNDASEEETEASCA